MTGNSFRLSQHLSPNLVANASRCSTLLHVPSCSDSEGREQQSKRKQKPICACCFRICQLVISQQRSSSLHWHSNPLFNLLHYHYRILSASLQNPNSMKKEKEKRKLESCTWIFFVDSCFALFVLLNSLCQLLWLLRNATNAGMSSLLLLSRTCCKRDRSAAAWWWWYVFHWRFSRSKGRWSLQQLLLHWKRRRHDASLCRRRDAKRSRRRGVFLVHISFAKKKKHKLTVTKRKQCYIHSNTHPDTLFQQEKFLILLALTNTYTQERTCKQAGKKKKE